MIGEYNLLIDEINVKKNLEYYSFAVHLNCVLNLKIMPAKKSKKTILKNHLLTNLVNS